MKTVQTIQNSVLAMHIVQAIQNIVQAMQNSAQAIQNSVQAIQNSAQAIQNIGVVVVIIAIAVSAVCGFQDFSADFSRNLSAAAGPKCTWRP